LRASLIGHFARVTHFKGRAGTDSFSVNHRFCAGEEKSARPIFPAGKWYRQILPGSGKYCRVKSAINSTFHKSVTAQTVQRLEKA